MFIGVLKDPKGTKEFSISSEMKKIGIDSLSKGFAIGM